MAVRMLPGAPKVVLKRTLTRAYQISLCNLLAHCNPHHNLTFDLRLHSAQGSACCCARGGPDRRARKKRANSLMNQTTGVRLLLLGESMVHGSEDGKSARKVQRGGRHRDRRSFGVEVVNE